MVGFIFFMALLPLPVIFHSANGPVVNRLTSLDSLQAINARYGEWESRVTLKSGEVWSGRTDLSPDTVRVMPLAGGAAEAFANHEVNTVSYRNHHLGSQIGARTGMRAGAYAGSALGFVGGLLLAAMPEPTYVTEASDAGIDNIPKAKHSIYYYFPWPDDLGYYHRKKAKWSYPLVGAAGGAILGASVGGGLGFMIGADAAGSYRVKFSFKK